ncbi:POU domain class 2-associating factor 1 [Brachionichthys hirsutus]|uniref:POU domain class 2-associating factor 1 n=1 Tax=Brachionichthys hirsutus TaxID=412623 RepID=UPI00360504B0
MHWETTPTSALTRPKPYQGVRVRDPVKELLRRKRSLMPRCTKIAPRTADADAQNSRSSYTQATSDSGTNSQAEPLTVGSDGGLQYAGWRPLPPTTSAGVHPTATLWSCDYSQQEHPAQTPASTTSPALTTDVSMQTLCPSYTMLTYTHTPLLTSLGVNLSLFQTIPIATTTSLHQMELPDSGLTYLPWAQPLTTISTLPNPGVKLAPGSAVLAGSPLVHMPLSMSLTTMIPQLDCQSMDLQPTNLDSEPQGHSLDDDLGVELESQNLLDKLLENQKADGVDVDKESNRSSFFTLLS